MWEPSVKPLSLPFLVAVPPVKTVCFVCKAYVNGEKMYQTVKDASYQFIRLLRKGGMMNACSV